LRLPEHGATQSTGRGRLKVFFWALLGASALLVGAMLWAAGAAGSAPLRSNPGGQAAADFSLHTADGQVIKLSDLRGKVVLVNFWATWCPPCKAEMPDLEALYAEHGADRDFVVLAVNLQERPELVEAFAQQYRLSFPVLLDASGQVTSHSYAVRSLPTTVVVDREGIVRDRWTGQLSKSMMLSRLNRIW
jgi:cytochrome c biogenesis protein CcmG, thiol:disulfide interchange protein DsbE